MKSSGFLLFLLYCVVTIDNSRADDTASSDQLTSRLLFVDNTSASDVTITNCSCTRYRYSTYSAKSTYDSLRHDADRCACDVTNTSRITEHALVVAANASQHWAWNVYEFVAVCGGVINQTVLDDVIVASLDNGRFRNFKIFNCNYTYATAPSPNQAAVVYGLRNFSVYDAYDALVTSWLVMDELDSVSVGFLSRNHVVMVHWSALLPAVMASKSFKAFSSVADDVAMAASEPVSAALRRVEDSDFVTATDLLITVIYVD